MRFAVPRYPVDRYLVESSNKFEMVSIINDDIWNVEPALRPEDEIMLRKLHDMLQSTADDLKVLSGELTRYHEPGVQVTTKPMPADDEFNEKVHIEEVVNAKFHGYTIVDESKPLRKEIGNSVKNKQQHIEQNVKNTLSKSEPEANAAPILKTSTVKRNLGISRTRTMQIIGDINEVKELQKDGEKMSDSSRFVAYSEVCYKYEQKPNVNSPNKLLKIQEMPSINIRSDLKEQKVFHLDIFPEKRDGKVNLEKAHNVSVIQVQHKIPKPLSNNNLVKRPVRKFTRISTNESSESTNNVSSEVRTKMLTHDKTSRGSVTINTKPSVSSKINLTRKEKQSGLPKRSKSNVDLWKKKLDYIYGQPSSSRKTKNNSRSQTHIKTVSPKKTSIPVSEPQKTKINDSCYIPYSQLTLGGVRVSDLEKELSDGQIKNDAPLTDILDKIISSKENSFHNDSPRKNIFTTSDENLLQEIINIESKISKPLSKTSKSKIVSDENTISDLSLETSKNQSYEDDFEEEVKSQGSEQCSLSNIKKSKSKVWNDNHKNNDKLKKETEDCINLDSEPSEIDHNDTTYIKGSNLSLRDNVDIHEYVHSIDTQDNATQINTTKSLQATQTSPTNCKNTIQPIRNDLWPNSEGEVAKMFEIEKDLIKKLIIKEYGDLIEKTINKPSSSCNEIQQSDKSKNVISTQKNTQTSPSHVKSVMTSPTTTKTRTTSPMELNITVDHQTSPIVKETDIKEPSILTEILKSATENLDITINLSSPRFNLRLPQTSREVLSNLELNGKKTSATQRKKIVSKDITCRTVRRYSSSSTSMDADASSSEISSIGEIQYKLKRMLRKSRNLTFSESSTASSVSKTSSDLLSTGILPLRSEGEMSLGQTALRQRSRKNSKSVEEKSLGQL